MLVYGYHLITDPDHLEVEGNEEGELEFPWFPAGLKDKYGDDLSIVEAIYIHLYNSLADPKPSARYDHEFEHVVKDTYGVWLESHCSCDYPMYFLATYANTASRGCPEQLNLNFLSRKPVAFGWDEKLQRALDVLGVVPVQQSPSWFLASMWC